MHPAYSVIVFTTASGAGYGLLIWLAVGIVFDLLPRDPALGFFGLGLALALITMGLLTSTFHLGRPGRAWRALSQWKTSWLSREGVAAIATYVPAALFGLGWVFGETCRGSSCSARCCRRWAPLTTLWCTGMIYASLPTIRAWHQPLVAPLYVVLGLATGGVLSTFLLSVFCCRAALDRHGERSRVAARRDPQTALLVRHRCRANRSPPPKRPPDLVISARCGRSIRRTPSRTS